MEREVIALRDQRRLVDAVRAELVLDRGRRRVLVLIEHAHPEAAPSAGDRLPDSTEPSDSQGAAGEVAPEEAHHLPAVEAALPNVPVRLDDAPRRREQQREREIGRRVGQDARRVGDRDVVAGSGGQVDVIVADGDVCNDF